MTSMRISGLASGLDIDSIVKQLMTANKTKLNTLNQKKTTLEWQRDQYRNVTSKLVDFRNNKLFSYNMQSTMAAKTATVTGTTAAQAAVSAKATSGATTGSMTIEVKELATAAQLQFKVNDTFTAGTFKIENGAGGSDTIVVNAGDTISTVIANINKSNANVSAFYDSVSGKMSITSKVTGVGDIAIKDDSTGIVVNNYQETVDGQTVVFPKSISGTNASVTINGITTTRSSNTFTENGVEITLNAKNVGSAATITTKTDTDAIINTIKSYLNDYNSILSMVTGKINEERYRTFKPLTSEQKKEMTDDDIKNWEAKATSGLLRNDSTLSKLVNDMRMASITAVKIDGQKIKANGSDPQYADMITLGDLGIDSGSWENRGQLSIVSESKLRAAIEADPDAVMKLFMQQSKLTDTDLTDGTDDTDKLRKSPIAVDSGVFNRMSNALMTALDELSTKVGTSKYSSDATAAFSVSSQFGDLLRSLDTQITNENSRLNLLETSYYKKFTAMEKALNNYSSQSSSLSSFL